VLVGLLILLVGCSGATSGPGPTSTRGPAVTSAHAVGARFSTDPPADWSGGTIGMGDLLSEALDTLQLVADGGPYPFRQDDGIFGNREGILPPRPHGTYREYTVETPGADDRGARRLVIGDGRDVYHTDDHYASFRFVVPYGA